MAQAYTVVFSEEEYMNLPLDLRLRASAFTDDYDRFKDDPIYKLLRKNERTAKDKLRRYTFDKRHGKNTI